MSTVAEIAHDLVILARYFGATLLEANHNVLFVGDNASAVPLTTADEAELLAHGWFIDKEDDCWSHYL